MQRRLAIVVLCLCLPACGGDGMGTIKGTVTLDGQPVPSGSVLLVNTVTGGREGAMLKDGTFEARALPGSYRVEINARKVVGKTVDKSFGDQPAEIDITEEMIPERYNKNSELTLEVKSGSQEAKFELKSP